MSSKPGSHEPWLVFVQRTVGASALKFYIYRPRKAVIAIWGTGSFSVSQAKFTVKSGEIQLIHTVTTS